MVLFSGGRFVPFGLVDRNLDILGTNMTLFDLSLEILPSSGYDLLPSLIINTVREVVSDLLIAAPDDHGVAQAAVELL